MANPGNYNIPSDNDLVGIIMDLQSRIADLEQMTRVSSASIDGGVLKINSNKGTLLWALGDIGKAGVVDLSTNQPLKNADGTPQMGVTAFRDSGESIFTAINLNPAQLAKQNWALWDVSGHQVMCDDVVSAQGLARPYIPMPFTPYLSSLFSNTQSSTFQDLTGSTFNWQHPRMYVDVMTFVSAADTTGQVRLCIDNGVAYGPTVQVGNGFGSYSATITLPAGSTKWGDMRIATIQACRTAGTGTVGVVVRGAWGIQS